MSGASRFYNGIEDVSSLNQTELIGYFVYFLTVDMGETFASPSSIDRCFSECDLPVPKNTSARLSSQMSGKTPRFVKVNGGYRLHREYRDEIAARIGRDGHNIQTSEALRSLEGKVSEGNERTFLTELITCFEAGANRATIVMCWILVIDHLYDYILAHHLAAFNAALGKVTDKRIKISCIQSRDDFSEIPEGKFIELLRSAQIISNDVRKILDEKLGTRNSSAHPSGVLIKPSKVVEFVDDLIENVVLKYRV